MAPFFPRHARAEAVVTTESRGPAASGNGAGKVLAESDRCARCVLPCSAVGLRFDPDGVCEQCKAEGPPGQAAPADTSQLETMIETVRQRGQGRAFDCVVGLSGGQDSSYLLYRLSRQHRLRCLAAYYRTPFTHDVIDENVEAMVKQLAVPLVRISIPHEYHTRIARRFVLRWDKNRLPELINLACAPCKLFLRDLLRVARAHRVRSVICGGNKYEEVSFLPAYRPEDVGEGGHGLVNQARKILHVGTKGALLLARCAVPLTCLPIALKASALYLTLYTPYLRLRYPGIFRFDYFFHRDWNEAECVRTIQQELGWRLPPNCADTWRADCTFADAKNYMFYKTVGATYLDVFLSNLIRAGQITRDQAVARLKADAAAPWRRAKEALAVLGVPPDFIQ